MSSGFDDRVTLPEDRIGRYLARANEFPLIARRKLLRTYGVIRSYYRANAGEYRTLQRWLNQSRVGRTYDDYLARSVVFSAITGIFGASIGLLLTVGLFELGVLSTLRSPVRFDDQLGGIVAANAVFLQGLLITGLSAFVFAGCMYAYRYYNPKSIAAARRRNINVVLPHAIVFMYALSYGGMNLIEVIRRLSHADDIYGEVAKEFDTVLRDVELFGNDLYTALQNLRTLTPSEGLVQFIDDMLSVLDSGGDLTLFLEDESQNYLEEARDEQESFLETLSILSEVFVVGFVAAPLFLIVTLLVISIVGGNTVLQITVLVYLGLPLGMILFMLLVDVLSQPFVQVDPSAVAEPLAIEDFEGEDDRYDAYKRQRRFDEYRAFFSDPLSSILEHPTRSLWVTAPVAVAIPVIATLTGWLSPSISALLADPLLVTTVLVVVPFLVMAAPLSAVYERKSRRERHIARRFPDTLNILASANEMGIKLTESLDLVSRWSSGIVADELRRVRNDIEWNADPSGALVAFADRMSVPQLTRTMRLIAEGIHSSGDLHRMLNIAAEDTRHRFKIDRQRSRAMASYIGIVVIGFLVYLFVMLMLDVSYLTPLSQLEISTSASEVGGTPFAFGASDIGVYRTLLFHSALVQAVGSGALAGKLANNSLVSGLKYSVALVVITLAVFAFI